jgi:ATP-dependent Clp protease protease subunit
MKDRFKFTAESSELEILIYGSISSWNISARWISELLKQNPSTKIIKLRINSLGGSVFEGAAIYNVLARHPAKKECDIDGVAASAASWPVMACDVRRIGLNGFYMIHEASGDTWGPAGEHEKTAKLLRQMNAQQVDIYAKGSKLSRADIAKAIEAETWYTAAEALKAGFVTEVAEGVEIASAEDLEDSFADYGFKSAPEAQLGRFFSFAATSRRERIPAELLEQLSAQAQPPAREPSSQGNEDTLMNKKALAKKLGISENASDEIFEAAIFAAVDQVSRLEAALGKTGDDAHGTALAWKEAAAQLPKAQEQLEALKKTTEGQELESLISDGKKAKKLTPALEKQIRDDVASKEMSLKSAKAFVTALPAIAALEDAEDDAEAETEGAISSAAGKGKRRSSAAAGTPKHKGKTYAEMTGNELVALKDENPTLFEAMREHAYDNDLV